MISSVGRFIDVCGGSVGSSEKQDGGWFSELSPHVASAVQEDAPEESHEDLQVVGDA